LFFWCEQVVLHDPLYEPEMHDQDYFNRVMKPKLRYAALDPKLFPNGSDLKYMIMDLLKTGL
jgi:hypothetical protein